MSAAIAARASGRVGAGPPVSHSSSNAFGVAIVAAGSARSRKKSATSGAT